MKKKFLVSLTILFFILIFSSPAVLAEAEEIFSDSVLEDDTFEIDDETYTVHEYADYTGVRISSNKYGSILIDEEGGTSTKGPYTFTLDSITQDGSDVTFEITVEKEQSSVSVTREATSTIANVGDEIEITVTISNEGDDSVSVMYSEDLPSSVDIQGKPEITKGTSTSSQKSTAADVYWSGVLYEDESATIVYTIVIDDYPSSGSDITFEEVTFTYEDDTGEYEDTVDTLTISLSDPLTVSFTLESDEDAISLGTEMEYTVALSNNLDRAITVDSFVLTIPSTVSVSYADTQLDEQEDGIYNWTGSLSSYGEQYFSVFIIPESEGTHTLEADAEYSYTYSSSDAQSYSTSESTSFSIDAADVVPSITLSSETFDGGEPIIITYYVNNSDTEISYSNVDITLTSDPSDLFSIVHYVASLPKNTKTLIKKQNFTAPYSDTALEYEVTMAGDLGGGSTFEESETISINAATFTVPYELTYTVDGSDEENTNMTLVLSLLTTMADKPSKLAVVHTADPEYKKTVSLTTDAIDELFTTQEPYSSSWSIPVTSFTDEEVTLDIQLQYTVNDIEYIKSLSETIPIYQEAEVEEEINETTANDTSSNETISNTTEQISDEINATEVNETEEVSVVITGEEEHSSRKWVGFLLILGGLGVAGVSLRYFIMKQQKASAIKKSIQNMTKNSTTQEKVTSIFEKAKEIIIHDVPSPEEGYEKLESFIRHSFSQGKNNEEIKKILAAKGWMEEIVESYLRRFK